MAGQPKRKGAAMRNSGKMPDEKPIRVAEAEWEVMVVGWGRTPACLGRRHELSDGSSVGVRRNAHLSEK